MEESMIRLFEIFREVVICGNISAAAKILHISQPAISVAIRDLETHYHCQLFERVGKKTGHYRAGNLALWANQHIA
jgi:LysR family transcriptional regulator, transcriptional activator of the cysJI operon